MFDLIFLATMTLVSPNHKSLASCQNAIREIYAQRLDPYNVIPASELKILVDNKMLYSAPKEYRCVKKA